MGLHVTTGETEQQGEINEGTPNLAGVTAEGDWVEESGSIDSDDDDPENEEGGPGDGGNDDDTPPETSKQETSKPKRKISAEKRISQLAYERTIWRQQAEEAQAALRSIQEATTSDQAHDAGGRLDPLDFASTEDYTRAVVDREMASRAKALEEQEKKLRVMQLADKGRQEYEDFDEIALNPTVPFTQHMNDAAMGDNWHKILYALGSEPEEARRIASLPPLQQAKEIGKIEIRVQSEKTKQITKAPAPPNTLRGKGQTTPTTTKLSRADLHAKWEKERVERIKKGYV